MHEAPPWFPICGRRVRDQAAPPRPRARGLRCRCRVRRSVHREPRQGCACRGCGAPAAGGAGSRGGGEQRQRERAHGTGRADRRRDRAPRDGGGARARARAGRVRLDRRDRDEAARAQDRGRPARAGRGARAVHGSRRRGDHDHGHDAQARVANDRCRRNPRDDRGVLQGQRDDRAAARDHGRGDRDRPRDQRGLSRRRARGGDRVDAEPADDRRRHEHERQRVRARERRGEEPEDRGVDGCGLRHVRGRADGSPRRARPPHRRRWRGRDEAHRDRGHGGADRGHRARHREEHHRVATREGRDLRRRSELGPRAVDGRRARGVPAVGRGPRRCGGDHPGHGRVRPGSHRVRSRRAAREAARAGDRDRCRAALRRAPGARVRLRPLVRLREAERRLHVAARRGAGRRRREGRPARQLQPRVQARAPGRGARLHREVQGHALRDQVRRRGDDEGLAEAVVLRRRAAAALGRIEARGGPRRRPGDHEGARAPRGSRRVRRRDPGHTRGGHARGRDGAHRSDQHRARHAAQPQRRPRGRAVGQGRGAAAREEARARGWPRPRPGRRACRGQLALPRVPHRRELHPRDLAHRPRR